MGKGYYFTLSIELPENTQKAKEAYTSENFIQGLRNEHGCDVEFDKINNGRAEYKVYMYEGREKVADG
jgi:hypothetical protein